VLANEGIAVALGVSDENQGLLTVIRRDRPQLILDRSTSAVIVNDREIFLTSGTPAPNPHSLSQVDIPGLGSGTELRVPFSFPDESEVVVSVTVLHQTPAFLYQLEPVRSHVDQGATYRFFDGESTLLLGDRSEYLTDVSRIRWSAVRDDGLMRREAIDFGKPLLFWGGDLGDAVLIATLDETDATSEFRASLPPGQVQGFFTYESRQTRDMGSAPRVYFEVTGEAQPRDAFSRYREVMAHLYPPRQVPTWVRHQWSSWYVYFMGVTDREIRAQVDYIAQNLADLGPWHVVIDAGWYVAEGRPGSDFRAVDRDKFPRGIRSVVDYVHSRGVKVVLYVSVPYLDSRERAGDWLGLKGLIETHRDCLVPLGMDQTGASYVFDFHRPCTQQYWKAVLEDFFVRYDVDGILVDGLGFAEGAILTPGALDPFGLVDRVVDQSVDIYRFVDENSRRLKPDVYVESGWHFPMMANGHTTTFWLSDSESRFSHPYPFVGLVQQIDYAAFQRVALGQRSHMAWITGDLNDNEVNRWWLEAALALGGVVGTGSNLLKLTDQPLSNYRARLVHQRPFEGRFFVDEPHHPTVFATVREGLAFMGLLNRQKVPQRVEAHLSSYGVEGAMHTIYVPENDSAEVVHGSVAAHLHEEAFRLVVIPTRPGVVWTDSSFEQQQVGNELRMILRGPSQTTGFAVVYAPGLRSVTLDGQGVRERAPGPLRTLMGSDYEYDAATGILRLRYQHDRPHRVRLELAGAPS
jgi:hypothetical protein